MHLMQERCEVEERKRWWLIDERTKFALCRRSVFVDIQLGIQRGWHRQAQEHANPSSPTPTSPLLCCKQKYSVRGAFDVTAQLVNISSANINASYTSQNYLVLLWSWFHSSTGPSISSSQCCGLHQLVLKLCLLVRCSDCFCVRL